MGIAVTVSKNLKREMEKRGMTKEELAKKSQLSVGTITNLLNAKTDMVRISTFVRVLEALNMTYAQFFEE